MKPGAFKLGVIWIQLVQPHPVPAPERPLHGAAL
jgi:hypothetical protein